jgi:type IV secretory pathway VirB10-like protein
LARKIRRVAKDIGGRNVQVWTGKPLEPAMTRTALIALPLALVLAACGAAEPGAEAGTTPSADAAGPEAGVSAAATPTPALAASATQDPPPVPQGIPADPDRPVAPPAVETPGGATVVQFTDRMLRSFKRLDDNGDGGIDATEMEAAGRRGGMLRRADANGDGRVTEAEVRDGAARMFSMMDQNGDGRLTEDERPQR